ncbi:lactonase family protein [Verrucomicrobia bacterium]|nr:lactonase family protein [Verrucomicrobiota bacterium]
MSSSNRFSLLHVRAQIVAFLQAWIFFMVFMVAYGDQKDVWIGTGSAWPSQGIYHCQLDLETGKLSRPSLAAKVAGPGFLAMHPKGSHLYAVASYKGKGSVVCYAIDQGADGPELSFVNALEIGDGGGTHLAVDALGRVLLTAQYGGGSVAVFALNQDGTLDRKTQVVEHSGGARVVGRRQDAPHPHWVGFSPEGNFVFVPDLGLDQVVIYGLDASHARIRPHGQTHTPRGGGPRHMKFHPNGRWAYVLNELSLSVTLCDYDKVGGSLLVRQTLPGVPHEQLQEEQFKSASEIRVHPSGRYVYAANRGHDTITAYRVHPETGELSVIEREHVRGATPRNFNIDPSGRWLLAAGQDSHTLASFLIDQDTGRLTYNRSVVHAPSAICVLFEHE